MTDKTDPAELLKGTTPGPWLYRPQECDDWGMVRSPPDDDGRMMVICQARNPAVGYDDLDTYRASKIDPYEANGRLIAAAPDLAAEVIALRAEVERYSNSADDAWIRVINTESALKVVLEELATLRAHAEALAAALEPFDIVACNIPTKLGHGDQTLAVREDANVSIELNLNTSERDLLSDPGCKVLGLCLSLDGVSVKDFRTLKSTLANYRKAKP